VYDIVLKGGTVVDGLRSLPFVADVCIKDGRIGAIEDSYTGAAKQQVDVAGRIVSPGFIDIHSHSDASPLVSYETESKLYQGVTLEIVGNCGISISPASPERRNAITEYFSKTLELPLAGLKVDDIFTIDDYVRRVHARGCAINYGQLVGHTNLRGSVMGFGDRTPAPEEMAQLKAMLAHEMEHGAFGMALGLIYPPSAYAEKNELVELARVVREHDGILTVHMRNEGPLVFEAVDEMIDITEQSGVHLQISHLKLMGKPQWGRAQELLDKIESARSRGVNITCDQYPYMATSTALTALIPKWAHDGGTGALVERIKVPGERLLAETSREMENRGGPSCVLIASTHGHHPEWEGKTIEQLSAMLGASPVETVMHALLECEAAVSCCYFSISEDDVLTIMKDMNITVASDGYSFSFDRSITTSRPHPRSFGTFPRFLQTVRDNKMMPIEDAVYKMTALPAKILGLSDMGAIKAGNVADITVFDYATVADGSDYIDPIRKPAGIEHVMVNGGFALFNGAQTKERRGRVVLHARKT